MMVVVDYSGIIHTPSSPCRAGLAPHPCGLLLRRPRISFEAAQRIASTQTDDPVTSLKLKRETGLGYRKEHARQLKVLVPLEPSGHGVAVNPY